MNRIAPPPRPERLLSAILGLMISLSGACFADAVSPVVGFLRFDCPGGSDTVVSTPFHPAPRWVGRLSSDPSDQGSGTFRLNIEGAPEFAPGELTDAPHFVFCRNGSTPSGRHFLVTAHSAATVDIAASAADLSGLNASGLVSVIPAWTLGTLLPADTQTALHPSTGNLATQRGSELLLFDRVTDGVNLAPARRFFVTASGWLEAGSYAPADDQVIEPGHPFVIRHRAGADATSFVAVQQVYGDDVTLPIRGRQAGPQDTVLGLPRPIPVKLSDLDLDAVFETSASTDPGDRKDELRVFANAQTGQNKAPEATYFKVLGQWIKDTTGFPVADNDVIDPAAGVLIRKAATTSDGSVWWVNVPRYDVAAP